MHGNRTAGEIQGSEELEILRARVSEMEELLRYIRARLETRKSSQGTLTTADSYILETIKSMLPEPREQEAQPAGQGGKEVID